jgi:hypothetical protein
LLDLAVIEIFKNGKELLETFLMTNWSFYQGRVIKKMKNDEHSPRLMGVIEQRKTHV